MADGLIFLQSLTLPSPPPPHPHPAAARLPLHLPDTVMASATGCATRLGPRVAEETLASLQRRFVTAQTLATPRLGAPVLTLDLGRLPAAGADLSPGGESGSEGEESEDGFTLHSQPAYERSLSQAHCAPGPPSCRTPSDEGGSTRFSFGCTQDAPMPLSAPGQGPAPEAAAGNTPLLDLAAPIGCVSDSTQKLFPIFKPKKDYKVCFVWGVWARRRRWGRGGREWQMWGWQGSRVSVAHGGLPCEVRTRYGTHVAQCTGQCL